MRELRNLSSNKSKSQQAKVPFVDFWRDNRVLRRMELSANGRDRPTKQLTAFVSAIAFRLFQSGSRSVDQMLRIAATALAATAAFDLYFLNGQHIRAVELIALSLIQRLVG
jgi:hypothetical protein